MSKKILIGIFEVDNFVCPILHNRINLSNNVVHNLLDYGKECNENLSVAEDKGRDSLLVIYSFIHEQVN